MHVPDKGGSAERAQNAAVPVHRAGDGSWFDIGAAEDVDEIIPEQKFFRLHFQLERRIPGAQEAVHLELRLGRGDFALGERYGLGIFRIVVLHASGYRNDARWKRIGRRPEGFSLGAEVLEV